MVLRSLALRFCPVRVRLCLAEGLGPRQAVLAGPGAFGDRRECRLDGGTRLGCGLLLPGGGSIHSPPHASSPPLWPALALCCWGGDRVVVHRRPHHALGAATHGARSLVDGGDVPLPGGGTSQLLPGSDPL